jgi:hypothetical protein
MMFVNILVSLSSDTLLNFEPVTSWIAVSSNSSKTKVIYYAYITRFADSLEKRQKKKNNIK